MNAEAPLYERDPEAWHRHLVEGNARQPRKRVGADALLRDEQGRILLVDPRYKPDWDLPGGMAEANESPLIAVRRELREELGHDLQVHGLLCVDWVAPHGPWDDSLMFIFNGGTLNPEQISNLRIVDNELAAYAFCSQKETAKLLRPYAWRRVMHALQALESHRTVYLHDGHQP